MESPFPGVDPYLEQYWPAVHTQLVASATRALNRVLPVDLVARPEERLAIASEEDLDHVRTFVADAAVLKLSPRNDSAVSALSAPFTLVLDFEPGIERYVKILDKGDRLITVIEFLSPGNKTGVGLDQYLLKRGELLNAGVHVVEVDLVRKGKWRELLAPHVCPAEAVAEYRAVIRLGERPGVLYVYPWSIRQALEPIPIPLRSSDAVVMLDVQQLLRDVYSEDRYGQTIDYSEPPKPRLTADAEGWARELLQNRGMLRD